MRGSLIFTLLVGGFVALLLWTGLGYPPEVQVLPLVVGIPTLSLTIVLLAGEFHPPIMQWLDSALDDLWGGTQKTSRDSTSEAPRPPWRPVVRIMTWAVSFFVAVFLFGLFVVPPIFIVLYLIAEAEMGVTRALLADAFASICLYGGMVLLRVEVWSGAIGEVIPGILGGGIIPPL